MLLKNEEVLSLKLKRSSEVSGLYSAEGMDATKSPITSCTILEKDKGSPKWLAIFIDFVYGCLSISPNVSVSPLSSFRLTLMLIFLGIVLTILEVYSLYISEISIAVITSIFSLACVNL